MPCATFMVSQSTYSYVAGHLNIVRRGLSTYLLVDEIKYYLTRRRRGGTLKYSCRFVPSCSSMSLGQDEVGTGSGSDRVTIHSISIFGFAGDPVASTTPSGLPARGP